MDLSYKGRLDSSGRPLCRAADICAHLSLAAIEELPNLLSSFAHDERKSVQVALKRARRRYEHEMAERARVDVLYSRMRELGGSGLLIGVDEVGRGAVAGPLCVCALALPDEPHIWGIDDSKRLTPHKREELAERIAQHALGIGLSFIDAASIDALGMSRCLKLAVVQAIQDSGLEPDCVLLDGHPLAAHPKERSVIKGDSLVACIAAASIVAKVARDNLMRSLDERYPGYDFASSKGYASAEHIAAIKRLGTCEIHRLSFCGNFVNKPLEQ